MEKFRKVTVQQSPVSERYFESGCQGLIDITNKQIRLSGCWFPYEDNDERWEVKDLIEWGDKIFCDNGTGYDLAIYRGPSAGYNLELVEYVSGRNIGITSAVSPFELKVYTITESERLINKYKK